MGWILGFGIPIGYLVMGLLTSRAAYRSRHKRDLNGYIDIDETVMLCVMMVVFWPALAPIYFTIVTLGSHDLVKRFYNHNLPETRREKENRLEREAREARRKIAQQEKEKVRLEKYIDDLEREVKVGPYREI